MVAQNTVRTCGVNKKFGQVCLHRQPDSNVKKKKKKHLISSRSQGPKIPCYSVPNKSGRKTPEKFRIFRHFSHGNDIRW